MQDVLYSGLQVVRQTGHAIINTLINKTLNKTTLNSETVLKDRIRANTKGRSGESIREEQSRKTTLHTRPKRDTATLVLSGNRIGLPDVESDLSTRIETADSMDALTLFGVLAVTAMLLFYALEDRSHWYILVFAGACAAASAYGFLQGAWPFGVVEAYGQE